MKPILVVALGPDDPALLTLQAAEALTGTGRVLLRTGRHGVARWLAAKGIAFETLDALYDASEDFDALCGAAADAVLAAAGDAQPFCYGVPDPLTDETVAALAGRGVPLTLLQGVPLDAEARAQALEAGALLSGAVQMVSGGTFDAARLDPDRPLLVTEVSSRLLAGEVKLWLLAAYPPEMRVYMEGKPVALGEMDRGDAYSHRTHLFVPASPMTARARYTFSDLLRIMARLRDARDGCPWDREQTHRTLRPYAIEEAYELAEAIDEGDMDKIADELGDVLLQVVFHAQIAQEHGEFDILDVTTAICHKMITRHAHIFGDVVCQTSEDVLKSWEAIKRKEKGLRKTSESMRGISRALPALMRAEKVQQKARQAGFDWDNAEGALQKVEEETREVRQELCGGRDPAGELGDLLFSAVNAARIAGVESEVALSQATEKFVKRFTRMERMILEAGRDMQEMTLAQMDAYWDAAKKETEQEAT